MFKLILVGTAMLFAMMVLKQCAPTRNGEPNEEYRARQEISKKRVNPQYKDLVEKMERERKGASTPAAMFYREYLRAAANATTGKEMERFYTPTNLGYMKDTVLRNAKTIASLNWKIVDDRVGNLVLVSTDNEHTRRTKEEIQMEVHYVKIDGQYKINAEQLVMTPTSEKFLMGLKEKNLVYKGL